MSVRPVVAGMRLGGRSPDARTGCGMHIRYGVEGVGGRGRTAFSVLGTMVDLVQCLYHSHMALEEGAPLGGRFSAYRRRCWC
jgi:hypothetical protein